MHDVPYNVHSLLKSSFGFYFIHYPNDSLYFDIPCSNVYLTPEHNLQLPNRRTIRQKTTLAILMDCHFVSSMDIANVLRGVDCNYSILQCYINGNYQYSVNKYLSFFPRQFIKQPAGGNKQNIKGIHQRNTCGS